MNAREMERKAFNDTRGTPMKIYKMKIRSDRIYVWFYHNIPEGTCQIGDKIRLTENEQITVEGIIKEIAGNYMEIARTLESDISMVNIQAARTWQLIKQYFRELVTLNISSAEKEAIIAKMNARERERNREIIDTEIRSMTFRDWLRLSWIRFVEKRDKENHKK